MDIGVIFSGKFGQRFVCNLVYPYLCPTFGACGIDECDYCKRYDFSSKISKVVEVPEPQTLGLYVENPEDYIEPFSCDVVVAINLHPDILVEMPDIVDMKLLIVPACDQNWCRPGLRRQLERKCEDVGIEFTSPKPFCILDGESWISKFCEELKIGRPKFKIKMNENIIERVEVVRSDPCGSAFFVAKRMANYIIDDVREFWKDIHQYQCAYPCMASMERDVELGEAPFHLAGYIMVYEFSKAAGIDAREFIPEHFKKLVIG